MRTQLNNRMQITDLAQQISQSSGNINQLIAKMGASSQTEIERREEEVQRRENNVAENRKQIDERRREVQQRIRKVD